jgi:hypothetical protein
MMEAIKKLPYVVFKLIRLNRLKYGRVPCPEWGQALVTASLLCPAPSPVDLSESSG